MMASNKIKLRNKAKSGQKNSKRALELLAKPDNLLSVILVGNNFANILASALVTILMINFFEGRVLLGSIVLTIIILIFSEITPKTTASAYPESFASKSSWVLSRLSLIFKPIVFFTNQVSSRLLNLLKVDIKKSTESDNLNTDELKILLDDSNSLTFSTRENKTTDLTEYYNFMYQYKNDCLAASIEYNKDYYSDRELKPTESIFFKLTIIPFSETSSPNLKN